MSTLAERAQDRTDLTRADLDHLQRLVAEWQLVADLSFADLVLWVRTHEGTWLAVSHIRPTTGPTTYPHDVVGTELEESHRVERAWREGRIVREGEPEWHDRIPVRTETIPVRRGERVVAAVQLASSARASQEELQEHCRSQLARYKVPDRIVFVDSFPRNSMNKILKRELRPLFQ